MRAHPGMCTTASRCLLESDGTLDIVAAGDSSSDDHYEATSFGSLTANETGLGIEELATALANSTAFEPSVDAFNASNATDNARLGCSTNDDSAQTSVTCNSFNDSVPTPQLGPASQILPDPGASFLNCPCNCTYVSSACCLSDQVWEDPIFRFVMASPPTNATVSCDQGSGDWISKTTTTTGDPTAVAAKSAIDSFDDLGSVQYSSPAAGATYWPKTTAGG